MDFTRSEAEIEVSKLAARILAGTGERAGGNRTTAPGPAGTQATAGSTTSSAAAQVDFDTSQWKELAQAGLLSLALPADLGGDELSVQAVAAVLTEVGRHAARIPALATLALGVLPVLRSADAALKRRLLTGVATGDTVLTAAIREPSDPTPTAPRTVAVLAGDADSHPASSHPAGTLTGVKTGVPYAAAARWILVPASVAATDDAPGRTVVAVIEPDADGLSCQRTRSSSGLPEYTLRLADTPITDVIGGCDAAGLYQLAVAGACAVADGVLAGALELTTEHIRTREQFGRPLATFQAVAQQIADVYATARTLHLATVSACWRLDTGRDAARDTEVAAYWLATCGPSALRTCHHLHGGLGMDVSYPLPGYSALLTDLVALVGGADYCLDRLAWRELNGPAHSPQPLRQTTPELAGT
jgi:3-oxo-4-pregnene-20-carboxyl-CoA dehydrogenase alpha subunit